MRDHLRLVVLFGKDYHWHQEPGRPLRLLPANRPIHTLIPDGPPEGLYEQIVRLYARPLPLPEETL